MKKLLILIFLMLVWGCEEQYTGALTKNEYSMVVRVIKACVPGEPVRAKLKSGRGEIFTDKQRANIISVSFSEKGYPTVMFGLNSMDNRIKCLKDLFGGNWRKVSSALLTGGVVFVEIAGLPAECLPAKRGYGFYCNIKYSVLWNKELGEIKSGMCAEFYSYLVSNGFKTINCSFSF